MLYTRVRKLARTHFEDFCQPMFGCRMSPSEMRDALLTMAEQDEPAFLQRLPVALEALVKEGVADQRRILDGKRPNPALASRRAYILPKIALGDGHASCVGAFARMPPALQQTLIGEHRLARFVLAAFVGTGASVSDEAREKMLGTAQQGLQVKNVPRPLPAQIVAHNADLFVRNMPLAGKQLLGNNGWAQVVGHWCAQGSGVAWQAVMMVTTDIHSQDGLVLWVMARLPTYPEGITWLSLHAGEHPVPSADAVNAFLAPLLLHPTFERGMFLAQLYPEISAVFGAQAPELMLNEEIRRWVKKREAKHDRQRTLQNSALNLLDRTGGYMMAQARKRSIQLKETHNRAT